MSFTGRDWENGQAMIKATPPIRCSSPASSSESGDLARAAWCLGCTTQQRVECLGCYVVCVDGGNEGSIHYEKLDIAILQATKAAAKE